MSKHHVLKLFLVTLVVACAGELACPFALQAAGAESAPVSMGDGLTRDSLSDFGAPEPAPAVQSVPVGSPVARARTHSRTFTHHHAVRRRPVRSSIRVVKRVPARRNPVASFVYWWNGWVIRTFHTTSGTVMLNHIGAKT